MTDRARPPSSAAPAAATHRPPPPPPKTPFREKLALPARPPELPLRPARPAPPEPVLATVPRRPFDLASAARISERPPDPRSEAEPVPVPDLDLAPFRVGPSILAPPIARAAVEPPVLDPALFSAEIVESMRVGRFGRDGHAMTMRVRGARGPVDVDLREDRGSLSLRISDPELAERVRSDLAARGIEIDVR